MSEVANNLAKRSEIHIARRAWHVVCGLAWLIAYYKLELSATTSGIGAIVVSVFGFALDFKRLRSSGLNNSMAKIFKPIMRQSEKEGFSGLPFYALGMGLSLLLFPEKIAVLGVMYLVFADPIASIVGAHFGKDRLFPNKTLQGTVAAFFVCFVITYFYTIQLDTNNEYHLIFAFLGAFLGSSSELLSAFNIDDNFTVPIVSSMGLTVFASLLGMF